jgi:hypothetical protein
MRCQDWSASTDKLGLSRSSVIGDLLVTQVPDASDERMVPLTFRPIDRFSLGVEGPRPEPLI